MASDNVVAIVQGGDDELYAEIVIPEPLPQDHPFLQTKAACPKCRSPLSSQTRADDHGICATCLFKGKCIATPQGRQIISYVMDYGMHPIAAFKKTSPYRIHYWAPDEILLCLNPPPDHQTLTAPQPAPRIYADDDKFLQT